MWRLRVLIKLLYCCCRCEDLSDWISYWKSFFFKVLDARFKFGIIKGLFMCIHIFVSIFSAFTLFMKSKTKNKIKIPHFAFAFCLLTLFRSFFFFFCLVLA